MQKFSLILVIIFGLTIFGCNNNSGKKLDTDIVNNSKSASGEKKVYEAPKMTFKKIEHNFGRLIQGEIVRYSYRYTNTGKSDLIISKVSTSCGCTVPSYSKTPLAPGESGLIEVIFDSKGKKGMQNKTITILANTMPNKTVLRLKASVVLPQNN
jgi:hypothetical protein